MDKKSETRAEQRIEKQKYKIPKSLADILIL